MVDRKKAGTKDARGWRGKALVLGWSGLRSVADGSAGLKPFVPCSPCGFFRKKCVYYEFSGGEWHGALHEAVEERDREGGVAMSGAENHPFSNE